MQQQPYSDPGANMQQQQQQQFPNAGGFNMPAPFSGPPVPPVPPPRPCNSRGSIDPHSGPHSRPDWQTGPPSYGPHTGPNPGLVIPGLGNPGLFNQGRQLGLHPQRPDAAWGAQPRPPPPKPELPPEPTEPAYKARVWHKASTEAVSALSVSRPFCAYHGPASHPFLC
jgi:hypothetical protein